MNSDSNGWLGPVLTKLADDHEFHVRLERRNKQQRFLTIEKTAIDKDKVSSLGFVVLYAEDLLSLSMTLQDAHEIATILGRENHCGVEFSIEFGPDDWNGFTRKVQITIEASEAPMSLILKSYRMVGSGWHHEDQSFNCILDLDDLNDILIALKQGAGRFVDKKAPSWGVKEISNA